MKRRIGWLLGIVGVALLALTFAPTAMAQCEVIGLWADYNINGPGNIILHWTYDPDPGCCDIADVWFHVTVNPTCPEGGSNPTINTSVQGVEFFNYNWANPATFTWTVTPECPQGTAIGATRTHVFRSYGTPLSPANLGYVEDQCWDAEVTFTWTTQFPQHVSEFEIDLTNQDTQEHRVLYVNAPCQTAHQSDPVFFDQSDEGYWQWFVRGRHPNGAGGWVYGFRSDYSSFTILNPVCDPVTNPTPVCGSILNAGFTQMFCVDNLPGQDWSYWFQISRFSDFHSPVLDVVANENCITPPAMDPTVATRWYWRVRSLRGCQQGPWMNCWFDLQVGPTVEDMSQGGHWGAANLYRFEAMVHGEPVGPATDPTSVELKYRLLPGGAWTTVPAARTSVNEQMWHVDVDLQMLNHTSVQYLWRAVNVWNDAQVSPLGANWNTPGTVVHALPYTEIAYGPALQYDVLYAPCTITTDWTIPAGHSLIIRPTPDGGNAIVQLAPGVRFLFTNESSRMAVMGTPSKPIIFSCTNPAQSWGALEVNRGVFYGQYATFRYGPTMFDALSKYFRLNYCTFESTAGPLRASTGYKTTCYVKNSSFTNRSDLLPAAFNLVSGELAIYSNKFTCPDGDGVYLQNAAYTEFYYNSALNCGEAGLFADVGCKNVIFKCSKFEYNGGAAFPELMDSQGDLYFNANANCTFRDTGGILFQLGGTDPRRNKFLNAGCNFFLTGITGFYISGNWPANGFPMILTGNYWNQGFNLVYFQPGDAQHYQSTMNLLNPTVCTGMPFLPEEETATAPDATVTLPTQFALHQNYPNPFNPSTDIRFDLPAASTVTLTVLNTLGQRVATLVDGNLPAGSHVAHWNGQSAAGTALPSGMYLYQIQAGSYTKTQKMILLK